MYLQISWSLTNDLNLLLVLFHRKCCTFNNGCPKLSLLPFSSDIWKNIRLCSSSSDFYDIMMEMIERSRGQIRYQISFCIAPAAKHIISTMRDETWLRQEMLRTSRSGEKHGNCSNGKTLTRGFLQEILMSFLVLFEISNNSTLYKCTMLIDLHKACRYYTKRFYPNTRPRLELTLKFLVNKSFSRHIAIF